MRIPPLEIGEYRFIRDFKLGYYYVALGLLAVSTLFLLWVTRSPFGKSLRAIRDNEDYARARGVTIARQRTLALVLSAVFTGVAGGFYAIYLRVASPEVFGFGTLSLALSMVLVGGVGTVWGAIVAAIALTFATEALAGIRGMEEARFILIALAMILVLRLAPAGALSLLERLVEETRGRTDPAPATEEERH
ncbi:MAG: branched-chain amino acid ABC transporter permease [Pseudomonadota bacterium]